ncbi:MAG: HAD family hydrolase [Paracoccaceae bacterium]
MKPDLVIFDCDGVLVDSEPITNRLLAEDISAHGLPISTEQCIELFVGGTIKSVFEKANGLGAALPQDWVAGFYGRMIETLGAEVEAIPGIHGVLDRLDMAGILYCIGSNGPVRKMEVTLGRTGLWDRFVGRVFSAHDVGIAKPEPGLFLHAARSFGTSPGRCVVVEDSASGVRAAQAAGMPCFGYAADTPAEKLTSHGAHAFDSMDKLPELLGMDS